MEPWTIFWLSYSSSFIKMQRFVVSASHPSDTDWGVDRWIQQKPLNVSCLTRNQDISSEYFKWGCGTFESSIHTNNGTHTEHHTASTDWLAFQSAPLPWLKGSGLHHLAVHQSRGGHLTALLHGLDLMLRLNVVENQIYNPAIWEH